MKIELIDFKTVKLETKLDTTVGDEVQLKQSGNASVGHPEELSGYEIIRINIKIFDSEEKYFLFDITTDSIFELPDEKTELTDEVVNECMELAQQRTFKAISEITVAMGINEIKLGDQE